MIAKSLSIVIPAYNEALRIGSTLERVDAYCRERFPRFEIIVVDDGSSDGTGKVVHRLAERSPAIRLLAGVVNNGKGHAVRKGVINSNFSLVLLCDADLSTPIEEIEKLLPPLAKGYDIAIGSRALQGSGVIRKQSWHRLLMGRCFNRLVKGFVLSDFSDTQCGFKLFKSETAKEIFIQSRIDGFAFDVEVLSIALKRNLKVKEVPVRWFDSPGSKVKLMTDPVKMLLDIARISIAN